MQMLHGCFTVKTLYRTNNIMTTPPWFEAIEMVKPAYFPETCNFTLEEVDNVLISLPNKASESDGVTYEVF